MRDSAPNAALARARPPAPAAASQAPVCEETDVDSKTQWRKPNVNIHSRTRRGALFNVKLRMRCARRSPRARAPSTRRARLGSVARRKR
eukprot:852089-Pyramimonas_sp.AAC.1